MQRSSQVTSLLSPPRIWPTTALSLPSSVNLAAAAETGQPPPSQKKLVEKLKTDAASIDKELTDAREKLARLEEEHNSKVEQHAKHGYDFKGERV
ncbi:hypothetical protein TSUD_109330 [Trifolium subterraneum]|nr:hypothetical protein TSUD_109330 [Trifolium subterraneum]